MADREEIQKQYSYHAMSNKVEQADRRGRRHEPTGEVQAIQTGRMGDAVAKRKPPLPQVNNNKNKKSKKANSDSFVATASSILEAVDGYQPTNDASRAAYETLLTLLGAKDMLGNQSLLVLRDAASALIDVLKSDEYTSDAARRAELVSVLGVALTPAKFTALVQIGKQLTDYGSQAATTGQADDDNDSTGVAVVFEDDADGDSEGDSDVDQDVVVEASSSSEDEGPDDDVKSDGDDNDGTDQEKLVFDFKKTSRKIRTLSVQELDAHFLQRQLSEHMEDADETARLAAEILPLLEIEDTRECENRLLVLLGLDMFDSIQLLLHNRLRVWACVSLKRAASDTARLEIETKLKSLPGGQGVYSEIHSLGKESANKGVGEALDSINTEKKKEEDQMDVEPVNEPLTIDLDVLAKQATAPVAKCVLPEGSFNARKKGYEEVHVPAVRAVAPKNEKIIAISDMPDWTRHAFPGMKRLNRVQSKMYDVALKSSENLLLCAPTGAGKTNVACLAMLNILAQYKREFPPGEEPADMKSMFDLSAFKIVYVAPMKALVQEIVKSFSKRLERYGVTVRELSGDSSMTRYQISETQVIITTPEKWDIVTRQGEGRAFTQLVKLVILDEIHLLNDERGPVLESIVARVIRQVEATAEPIRLVGLSATLPNYADVAAFLRVDVNKGMFFFDSSYRPVPLQMQYVGITERSAFKRIQLQNEICYEKIMDQRRGGHQVLVFVHSRAETGKTAKALRDMAIARDELSFFVRDGSESQEILRSEAEERKNADLKDVLACGFGMHHAGMSRDDRGTVEDLFFHEHIPVLFSTATLAWGVNLPAHAVIIRGTQIYDPSKGCWAELSPLDILQMLGRAGRFPFDNEGEGIILTQHSQLQFYLSLTNLQVAVESQLIRTLPDHLNAEVVLGTVQTIEEAVEWLGYSFLYVRMLRNPAHYGVADASLKEDPSLKLRRRDLVHSAAVLLEKSHLVRYDRVSGSLQATPLGRIASKFYLSHGSMAVYTKHMRANMSDVELLRLFSLSGEFEHITVREDEKLELTKLAARVPIPIKESPTERLAKVNVLLQAYISRMKLEGFALAADMAFVQQSGARIMRALFEIALRRNWSSLAKLCLDFSTMVSCRIWRSQTPLRQFKTVPEIIARKLERKSDIEWERYAHLTPADIGELIGVPKTGQLLHKLVHQFPRLDLAVTVLPITRSMLQVSLRILPAFQYDTNVHGFSSLFHVVVEDVNGDTILHRETFALRANAGDQEHSLSFFVPVLDPLPPVYYVRVLSDRWLHSTSTVPINLSSLILPAKFPSPTELLDLQPLLPKALQEPSLIKLFPYKEFNPIQTQTFHELFKTDRNCLVCAPSGAGKSTCILFAFLRMLTSDPDGKCAYIAPNDNIVDAAYALWQRTVGSILPRNSIAKLTGESSVDLLLLKEAKVVMATLGQWDVISRRWRQRKSVQTVSLYIFDELHFLGGNLGPQYEVVVARTRYIGSHMKEQNADLRFRIVGFGASLANAKDVGDWIGVSSKSLFNFSPRARPFPLEIFFQAFEEGNYSSRLLAMAKPVYNSVERHLGRGNCQIYVPSKRQAQLTAIDLMTYSESRGKGFVPNLEDKHLEMINRLHETALQQVARAGIAYLHSGMNRDDWQVVFALYDHGVVRVVVCPVDLSWRLARVTSLVVVMGTETYDGSVGSHVNVPAADLLHMVGRCDGSSGGKVVIMYHAPKKDYIKKLLYDPLPIESHLDSYLHDPLVAEVVTKTVASMQDAIDYMTWTFLYRRLAKNPSYYRLQGTTNVHISEHLSELIETVVGDLEESRCCQVSEEGDISPLNLGMIAAYYDVQYRTVELIASSVTAKTKIRGILEVLAASWEFALLQLRYGEDKTMKVLSRTLVHKLPDDASFDANTKALILLQTYCSRKSLPSELREDQRTVIVQGVKLIQVIVDVVSSLGWLKPALAAMELSQMLVQGLWNKDHPLLQIPHFNQEIVTRCLAYKGDDPVESVLDILTIDDDVRNKLLQLPDSKMADVAVFCNNYPSVDVSFSVTNPDDVTTGEAVEIVVVLEREVDEDEEEPVPSGTVSSSFFPGEKKEAWWVVIGNLSENSLLSLRRINLGKKSRISLEFIAPKEAGDYDLTLFCMCDSYLGCDQEYSVPLSVAVGSDSETDEDSDTS